MIRAADVIRVQMSHANGLDLIASSFPFLRQITWWTDVGRNWRKPFENAVFKVFKFIRFFLIYCPFIFCAALRFDRIANSLWPDGWKGEKISSVLFRISAAQQVFENISKERKEKIWTLVLRESKIQRRESNNFSATVSTQSISDRGQNCAYLKIKEKGYIDKFLSQYSMFHNTNWIES